MIGSTRKTFAIALLLCGSSPALAGSATLSDLITGSTITSDNGKLVFSNFTYYNYINGPVASDIQVVSTESGLTFASPIFTFSNNIDFNIHYTVDAGECAIESASTHSTGSGTGNGYVAVLQVVETESGQGVGNLTNAFANGLTLSNQTVGFAPKSSLNVRTDFAFKPGSGTAGLSDVTQNYSITCPTDVTAVPTPSALIAGIGMLGFVAARRRRATV